jgi:hypothetical protein
MVIDMPSNGQRFRRNDFRMTDRVAENCIFGQIAASKEKKILRLFVLNSSDKMNTKMLGNSPSFPLVTYSAISD